MAPASPLKVQIFARMEAAIAGAADKEAYRHDCWQAVLVLVKDKDNS